MVMASIQAQLYKTLLRHTVRGRPITPERIQKTRRRVAQGFLPRWGKKRNVSAPTHIARGDGTDLHAVWMGRPDAHHILYYLHGGGYMIGGPESHRHLIEAICAESDMKAFVPDYRLAPENPFPAGLEDGLAGYRWLLAQGYSPERIHFAGDSAGGGLALATCLLARQQQVPLPRSLCLLSPWTDLTASGSSHRDRAQRDPMLDAALVPEAVALYAGDEDPKNPLISPLWGELQHLPPTYVQVGTEEILYDDGVSLVAKIKEQGGHAELDIWPDMPHVHQIAFQLVPEGRQAITQIGDYLRRQKP